MMLRTLVLAAAILAPSLAAAEERPAQREHFRDAAVGAEVRGHDGALLGVVTSAERNANGEVIAAEIPGLEPADAPAASSPLVADNRRDGRNSLINARRDTVRIAATQSRAR